MLSQDKFELLSITKQIAYLALKGTYLASREQGKFRITLFYLNTFFVEIWHKKENPKNLIILTFSNNADLDVYLKCIELEFD